MPLWTWVLSCKERDCSPVFWLMELKSRGWCFEIQQRVSSPLGSGHIGWESCSKIGYNQRVWAQCLSPLVHHGFVGLPQCPSRLGPFGVNAVAEIILEMKVSTAGQCSHPISAPLHLLRGFHPFLFLFCYHRFDQLSIQSLWKVTQWRAGTSPSLWM